MTEFPLYAVGEGDILHLHGDKHVDPDGTIPELAEPVEVVSTHAGPPTNHDRWNAYKVLGDAEAFDNYWDDPVEGPRTLILTSRAPSRRCVVAFFPNDGHEATFVLEPNLDEDDDDENYPAAA